MSKKQKKVTNSEAKQILDERTKGKGKRQTFMQWVTISPIWFLIIGVVCLGAGVYGILKPTMFASEGELSRVTNIILFFVLGAVMIYMGAKYIREGKTEAPRGALWDLFNQRDKK